MTELDAPKQARSILAVPISVLYVIAGLALLAGYYAVPGGRGGPNAEWKVVLYLLVSVSAPAAVLFGILRYRPARPFPWYLVFANQIVYASADVTFFIRHDLLGLTQYPTVSDILYLAHYPLLIAALVVFISRRTPGGDRSALIDGGILVVAAAMLSWIFVIAPSFDAPGQDVLARVTSAAYPIMDLAMLAIVLWMLLGAALRTRAFWALAVALILLFATDTIYALQQIDGTYHPGNFLDGMWVAYYLLIGASMLDPSMVKLDARSPARDMPPAALRFLGIGMATLAVPAVLLVEQNRHTAYFFPVVAAGTTLLFGLVITRLMRMISDQRRMAITDTLTGLRNRRYFEAHYAVDCSRARRSAESLSMVLFDVDFFKSVNDEYGHSAGDRVLAEIARRLSAQVRVGDVLARYGGEEFAMLLFGAHAAEARDVADRCRDAIATEPFVIGEELRTSVTVSAGLVSYPEHVSDPSELLVGADRAMYAAKEAGRDRVVGGSFDPPPSFLRRGPTSPVIDFLEALSDRVDVYQAPFEHGSAIARWSVAMANELGLDESTQRRCNLAARLHDIGKVAVPLHILQKEGTLTPEEWELIRDHPAQGELLISAVPGLQEVAEIVGQHHERVDGTGYPRGLHKPDIRIEARILSVCDTFASMLAARAYQPPLSEQEARARLLDARGGQLSAELVNLFVDLLDRELVGHLGQLAHGPPRDGITGNRQIDSSIRASPWPTALVDRT